MIDSSAPMPKVDMHPDHWRIVQGILRRHVPHYEVWAFGSRAKWTAKSFSDLDIAIITDKPLSLELSAAMADDFSDSALPWKVDVVDWAATSESFRKVIERDKVALLEADAESRLWPLEDVIEDILDRRGVTPYKLGGDFTSTGHRVISAKVVKGGRIDLNADEARHVDSVIYKKWMRNPLRADDVIMTSEAPLGELAYLERDVDWVLGQRLFAIRPRAGVLSGRYLYYALATQEVRERLIARSSGTTVLGIRQAELRKVEIPLLPFHEQLRVAHVLGAIDDRVDNLHQANSTLEAIAQALFKSWFVDFDQVRAKAEGREPEGMDAATAALFPSEFEDSKLGPIPKGWHVDTLGKVSQNIRDQAKPKDLEPSTPYIGLEHMPRKSIALTDHGIAEGLASGKFWYRTNDILFGKLRPYFHKVGVAEGDGVCSTDILVVRPASSQWFGYAAMQFSSDAVVAYATQLSNGAKMPRTNWNDLTKYRIVLPPDKIAEAFDSIVRPIIARIHRNIGAARSLADLRDALLPRLISGKLRLPDAQALLEEVAT